MRFRVGEAGDRDGPGAKDRFAELWRQPARHLAVWGGVLLLILLLIFVASGICVVNKGEAAILIRKTGEPLRSGEIIATKPGQKGIQEKPLAEGFYWLNPYTWDWIIVKQVVVPPGKMGVVIRNFGEPLGPGQVIAGEGQKGILAETLRPGMYPINTLAYSVKLYDEVKIPPGHVGVVVRVSGAEPRDPNQFLVEEGERGVQKVVLEPGTYYRNPFVERILPVTLQTQRFDLSGDLIVHFPSLDGFDISMEGTIEWQLDPQRVPEVIVKFVGADPVVESVVEEIILPNARAISRLEGSNHLARDFISGETRQKFQEEFLKKMREECGRLGILIHSTLIRETRPPEEIARPIRERELAIRNREMLLQQIEREKQQKLLSMEEKLRERKTQLKQAEADVAVAITKAEKEREVAVIDANRQLELAKLKLEAAKNEAAARLSRGRAQADVVVFRNSAEAAGLRNAVGAFGSGQAYVTYLLNLKLAPAFRQILSNTDGPFLELFRRIVFGTRGKGDSK